jgi:hypothetical protein
MEIDSVRSVQSQAVAQTRSAETPREVEGDRDRDDRVARSPEPVKINPYPEDMGKSVNLLG